MFKTFFGQPFPQPLRKRIVKVFDIRNSIVHYKGLPGHPDRNDGSHFTIQRQLGNLRRMSLTRDYSLLRSCVTEGILKIDLHRNLATKAAAALYDAEVESEE